MGASYFQFKQFRVEQSKAAMKVCTDACLFGAWIANTLRNTLIQRALDIGTGTGLLALQLAQVHPKAVIDGVELNEQAAAQAAENFSNSQWAEQLHIHQADIRSFTAAAAYDLMLCNPPFFTKSLQSPAAAVNLARHEDELSLATLFSIATDLLTPDGRFALLLPYERTKEMLQEARVQGFHPTHLVSVKHSPAHAPFRVMAMFAQTEITAAATADMVIKNGDTYTVEFQDLLRPYYLYL